MRPEDISRYLGKPYRLGGEGPDAYDCRGLVRAVLRDHFGVLVPELPLDGLGELWGQEVRAGRWKPVDVPEHGDPVVLRGGDDPHIGIWLTAEGAGVLHAFAGARQVVWTPAGRLRLIGFSRLRFVRVAQ